MLDGVDLSSHDGVRPGPRRAAGVDPAARLPRRAWPTSTGERDAGAQDLRAALARRTEHAVTFGWGPRFLHSTGQYHKGGPQVGAFLQVTGAVAEDLAVPDQPFTFGTLQAAQAAGDRKALADRERPLLHLHLTDRAAGIAPAPGRAGLTVPIHPAVRSPAGPDGGPHSDLEDGS